MALVFLACSGKRISLDVDLQLLLLLQDLGVGQSNKAGLYGGHAHSTVSLGGRPYKNLLVRHVQGRKAVHETVVYYRSG
jgi:hypothetical protein